MKSSGAAYSSLAQISILEQYDEFGLVGSMVKKDDLDKGFLTGHSTFQYSLYRP